MDKLEVSFNNLHDIAKNIKIDNNNIQITEINGKPYFKYLYGCYRLYDPENPVEKDWEIDHAVLCTRMVGTIEYTPKKYSADEWLNFFCNKEGEYWIYSEEKVKNHKQRWVIYDQKNNKMNSEELFFSVRHIENIHIYFWILKDLGWLLDNPYVSITFGILSLLILMILFYINTNYEELYFICVTFIWLFSNFIWMVGDVLQYDTKVYQFICSCGMTLGICLIACYYVMLLDLTIFSPEKERTELYTLNGLTCRFKSISTWRRYDFMHMLSWMIKDLAWSTNNKFFWLLGAGSTTFISLDQIYTSSKSENIIFDCIHYVMQAIWVLSNMTWAFSEIYNIGNDKFDNLGGTNGRSIATYMIIFSFSPILFYIPYRFLINYIDRSAKYVLFDDEGI